MFIKDDGAYGQSDQGVCEEVFAIARRVAFCLLVFVVASSLVLVSSEPLPDDWDSVEIRTPAAQPLLSLASTSEFLNVVDLA